MPPLLLRLMLTRLIVGCANATWMIGPLLAMMAVACSPAPPATATGESSSPGVARAARPLMVTVVDRTGTVVDARVVSVTAFEADWDHVIVANPADDPGMLVVYWLAFTCHEDQHLTLDAAGIGMLNRGRARAGR
ncbi:MAG: hypothetical protein AB1627_00395 [Chloroflexota bacterium]